MSVLFETSAGDIIVDLETELCPKTSENFLKLCKTYYYNFCAFFNVQRDFIAQTGDPTDTGTGGTSIYNSRYFEPEIRLPALKHVSRGTLSMAIADSKCGSQFFITLADGLDYLDGKHSVFGRVVEGWEALDRINEALVDSSGRPLRDIRLRHVIVLDDPFPDPVGLDIPTQSPAPTAAQLNSLRVAEDETLDDMLDAEEVEKNRREREARAQALTLEMVGDLPFAEAAPPENVLFVCKLNAITRSEDLELIFSRFGKIMSCEVIKDKKTGDSLQYAFIEFGEQSSAEQAYFKMDNVLIDDRRIHVDFSQSVSKLHDDWNNQRKAAHNSRKPARVSDKEGVPVSRKTDYERSRQHDAYRMTFDDSDLVRAKPDAIDKAPSRQYHDKRSNVGRDPNDERRRRRSLSPRRRK